MANQAVTYPLAFPAGFVPVETDINIEPAVAFAASPLAHYGQAQDWGGRLWRMRAVFAAKSKGDAGAFLAFLSKLAGMYGSFRAPDWDHRTPRGSPSGTPLVNGAGQTGNLIATDGWTPSTTGLLLPGDVCGIGDRIHRLMQSVDSDGAGNANLWIDPPIDGDVRASPADNAAVTVTNAQGVWRLARNYTPAPSDFNGVFRFTLEAFERLP